ncbi:MAG: hypothetical protein JWQ66_4161, partial [Mucilaginibacter sp.]|nr:hypothetical protein [Mucilaginibacter sp.]
ALVALQATFAAQASNLEAESAIELAYTQSIDLYNTLTGKIVEKKTVSTPALDQLLHTAYANAKAHYVTIEQALAMATHQLSAATADLNKAQARLNSLQAGLAAANTAALAS